MQNVAISVFDRRKLERLGLSLSKKKLLIYTLNFMPNTALWEEKGDLPNFRGWLHIETQIRVW